MIMLNLKDKILYRICKILINKHMKDSKNNARILKTLESLKENNSDGKSIKKT